MVRRLGAKSRYRVWHPFLEKTNRSERSVRPCVEGTADFNLQPGETYSAKPVISDAMEPLGQLHYDIQTVGSIRTAIFGGAFCF